MNLKRTLTTTIVILALVRPIAQGVAADADAGKTAYEKTCVGCHGADGKGNPGMAKVIGEKGLNIVGKDTTTKSDDQLLKVIAEGAGKMPASKLTKVEQKQALGYVRTLAK